jgi:hypothetical protein
MLFAVGRARRFSDLALPAEDIAANSNGYANQTPSLFLMKVSILASDENS